MRKINDKDKISIINYIEKNMTREEISEFEKRLINEKNLAFGYKEFTKFNKDITNIVSIDTNPVLIDKLKEKIISLYEANKKITNKKEDTIIFKILKNIGSTMEPQSYVLKLAAIFLLIFIPLFYVLLPKIDSPYKIDNHISFEIIDEIEYNNFDLISSVYKDDNSGFMLYNSIFNYFLDKFLNTKETMNMGYTEVEKKAKDATDLYYKYILMENSTMAQK